jgi:hypothetical protein
MFNPTLIVIEVFIRELRAMYERTYMILEPNYAGILSFAAQLVLETIATSDAVYHDVNHTIMVTLVGQAWPAYQRRRCDPARLAAFHRLSPNS